MRAVLPSIQIRTDNAARFCDAATAIAQASGSFTVVRDSAFPEIVGLKFTGKSSHKELSVQLIRPLADTDIVTVHIRASVWDPEPPSYETYRTAAEAMVGPILRIYNRTEHKRYRMTITPKKALEPHLPPKSNIWFKRFADNANKSALHPNDWRRFYDFVRFSRARRVKLAEEDLIRLLLTQGFGEDTAADIACAYGHICEYERPRNTAEKLSYFHFKELT